MSSFANMFSGGSTKSGPPAWLEQAGKNIYGKALDFYNKGYTPYKGQRVAGFNPTQTSAFGELNDKSNYDTADMNTALDWTKQAHDNIPTMDNVGSIVDKWMNPYISKVVDPAVAQINRSADTERGKIGDNAFAAHAFGDARQGVRENELARQTETAIGDTTGQLYNQGFNTAITDSMAAAQEGLGAANQLGNQATAHDTEFMNRVMAKLGVGNLQQQNQQSRLDTRYQGYQAAQQDPYDRLAALMSVIQGVPYTRTTSTSSNPLTDIFKLIGSARGSFA